MVIRLRHTVCLPLASGSSDDAFDDFDSFDSIETFDGSNESDCKSSSITLFNYCLGIVPLIFSFCVFIRTQSPCLS